MEREIRVNGRLVGQAGKAAVNRQTGVPLQRQQPARAQRSPEASACGAAVHAILLREFGGAEWLHQVQDGVELFVERCLEQFAGSAQPSNSGPISDGGDYRARARTAEEIKATMAAESAAVSAAPQRLGRFREDPREVQIPESEIVDPMSAQPPTTLQPRVNPKPSTGWSM